MKTFRKYSALILLALAALLCVFNFAAAANSKPVQIYLFRGDGCSHCAALEPYLQYLKDEVYGDSIEIHDYEIWYNAENAEKAEQFAAAYGEEVNGVPMTYIGRYYISGFSEDTKSTIRAAIENELQQGPIDPQEVVDGIVDRDGTRLIEDPADTTVSIPLIGEVNLSGKSQLLTTIIIGIVDGVNPCSLWVLTMLLAMVVHTDSRKKTLIIGFVYIFVTAGIYALFILGVFSLLSYVRYMKWIQVGVAVLTLILGLINLKDYFFFKQGVSLTIEDEKKPGLYKKMRNVVKNSDNMGAMIGATIALAAGVSLVEFSCTAAFPVIWSNILASRGVGKVEFALLLLLYMVLYQLDEIIIFLVVTITMKSRKMGQEEGRVMKLFSGLLMVTLSIVMIVNPSIMNNLGTTLLVFALALIMTLIILLLTGVILPKFGIYIGHVKDPEEEQAKKSAVHEKKGTAGHTKKIESEHEKKPEHEHKKKSEAEPVKEADAEHSEEPEADSEKESEEKSE